MPVDTVDHAERTQSAIFKVLVALIIIGAINWGLIGFFNFNVVDAIFGGGAREETSGISRVIYALVGIAGLATAAMLPSVRARRTIHTVHP
jgi:uncharacterized protein